jgi:rhomboid-like protein
MLSTMFRSRFLRNATCRIVNAAPRHPPRPRARGCRSYSTPQHTTYFNLPPVRALGPAIWVFTVAGTIYLGCAAYEVRQDVQEFKKQTVGPVTYDTIDTARSTKGARQSTATMRFSPVDVFTTPWSNLNSAEKMLTTCGALNLGIYGASSLSYSVTQLFWHVPINPSNFTLLTSMFGHAGLLHLSLNMYALFNFGPVVAGSPTFESSGSHLTAFYLSSGLVASLAHHLSSIWPNKMSRMSPGLGASGAIYAMLGAFAMSYPNSGIGIMFVPGSIPAEQALVALFAFETWGTVIGFSRIAFLRGIGHSAHLGGLCAGVAYVGFDGKKKLWQPTRKFAFNQMRRLNLV